MVDEFEILGRIEVLKKHLDETALMAIKSLRMQGYSLSCIADAMGLTRQTLRKRLATGYYGEVVPTDRIAKKDRLTR